MKKSTVLIIVVAFAVSVFVVGVFGMKNVPYNERIYIEQIVPVSVTLSTGDTAEIKIDDKQQYYVYIPYEQDMVVLIDYEITPNDATNRELRVTIDNINDNSNAELTDHGGILLKDAGLVKVTYAATDSPSAPKMVFLIYTYQV